MRTLAVLAILIASLPAAAQNADTTCRVMPGARAVPGVGATVGATFTCRGNTIGAGYQFNAGGIRVGYVGRYKAFALHAQAVSSEFQWYYGLGNQTAFNNDSGFGDKFYRARQSYFALNPEWTVRVAPHTSIAFGPDLRYWETSHLGGFVDSVRPYGIGPFGTISGLMDARYATRLLDIDLVGRGVPDAWDALHAYGTVHALATTHIPLSQATLVLRVGGEKVWGDAPFQDLAHMSVRGYLPERYTGDASAFGNAQVEVPVGHAEIFVPLTVGFLVINDVGRVFEPGDRSSEWHDGIGGGVFFAPANRRRTVSLSLIHGDEGTRLYLGYGREL